MHGIFWIGLLYYFNAVQTPAMGSQPRTRAARAAPAINKYVAPRALLWFRWSALATWFMGAWLLSQTPGRFISAFSLSLADPDLFKAQPDHWNRGLARHHHAVQCLGAHLAPTRRKILGIVPATDEQKAKARKVALYASRTNFCCPFPC